MIKKNLATWHSYDGEHSKQIDYIMIDHRYRNWIKEICNKENANIINPMQHRAIIAKIKIKLKTNYFGEKPNDNCPYDIKKFRGNPQGINHKIGKINWQERGSEETWNVLRENILNILTTEFPKPKGTSNHMTQII